MWDILKSLELLAGRGTQALNARLSFASRRTGGHPKLAATTATPAFSCFNAECVYGWHLTILSQVPATEVDGPSAEHLCGTDLCTERMPVPAKPFPQVHPHNSRRGKNVVCLDIQRRSAQ